MDINIGNMSNMIYNSATPASGAVALKLLSGTLEQSAQTGAQLAEMIESIPTDPGAVGGLLDVYA
jgi:hypothetical protein